MTNKEQIKMVLETPRGTFKIHTIFESIEEARENGWGLWFWHGKYMILSKNNRVGAVVVIKGRC